MGLVLFKIVASSLGRHVLRTVLAVLGISIGIGAVIATAALGAGSAARVDAQIDAMGEDFLWIRAGRVRVAGVRSQSGAARSLTLEDMHALMTEVPEITMCSPRISGREQIIVDGRNWNTNYRGVSPAFFEIRDRAPIHGTVFTPYDAEQRARVLVLGPTVADRLFDGEDPVGRTVRMGRYLFQVIGVLESKGAERGGLDRDDAAFLPMSTVHRNLQRRAWIDDIMCSVVQPAAMPQAEQSVAALLRLRHELLPDEPDDFEVQQPLELLQMRAGTANTMRLLLTGIGSISLIVGGVGIMNIMLVSVAERRREIGVRMAIGARSRDVRLQFLTEAAVIGLGGGVLGIAIGLGACWFLAASLDAAVAVSPSIIVSVTAAAIGAGLVFGYLPAHRASRLDPIEAMRAET